jgi:phospholipid/cholesterol/gamma-HCH transport system permease protein
VTTKKTATIDDRGTVGRRAGNVVAAPFNALVAIGQQLSFYVRAFGLMPRTARRYKKEVVRLIAEVSLGSGGLAVIGGTVVVVVFMTGAVGVEVGLQGFTSLSNIGVAALSGFVSSYANTREVAPVLAGIALTATVGAGFTAQLGAMRISEEIDALETMAVPSIPFLVTTRILAGSIAVIPLYSLALLGSYVSTKFIVTVYFGQSVGSYSHYFSVFLVPSDILISFAKALTMALVVMSVTCYYGYRASGGPAGVGKAVGDAVRLSLMSVMFIDLLMDLAIYGGPSSVHVTG